MIDWIGKQISRYRVSMTLFLGLILTGFNAVSLGLLVLERIIGFLDWEIVFWVYTIGNLVIFVIGIAAHKSGLAEAVQRWDFRVKQFPLWLDQTKLGWAIGVKTMRMTDEELDKRIIEFSRKLDRGA